MTWRGSRALGVAALLAACLALARPAHGYEFAVSTRTIGQGYALRSFRLLGSNVMLGRLRFTQTLALDIWDLGGLRAQREARGLGSARGPHIYLTTYLRLEHDFGPFAGGPLTVGSVTLDAVDFIPELEDQLVALDVLYAYAAAEGLLGGVLDLRAGRLLEVNDLDWMSFDGAQARVTTPLHVAVQAFGGLRVRDTTPLGSSAFAPDGTGSAECAEYVEGPAPGSGSWRPIDRQNPGPNNPFGNDYDRCPQSEELMPTFGASIETTGLDGVWARIGYRRAMSATPGIIGPVDRFPFPDVGYYPDEEGQAPGWGVNEELLSASFRSNHALDGGFVQITPYAAARYNLLLGTIDEAHAGARLRWHAHALSPELYYVSPSFDGDSIFNVFSSQPYIDGRMTYDVTLARLAIDGYARVWLRRFGEEDGQEASMAGAGDGAGNLAGGAQAGARYRPDRTLSARLDLFHDDGYGGQRTGGHAAGDWQLSRDLGVRARISVIHFDAALPAALHAHTGAITFGVQAGASYRIDRGVTVHAIVEDSDSRVSPNQLRVLGVLDLAFVPEV